jgi:hypothetical protein
MNKIELYCNGQPAGLIDKISLTRWNSSTQITVEIGQIIFYPAFLDGKRAFEQIGGDTSKRFEIIATNQQADTQTIIGRCWMVACVDYGDNKTLSDVKMIGEYIETLPLVEQPPEERCPQCGEIH